ncbi:uncharacterized protein [Macrobrachium rosenbergii]|uniref:uncharacterized protein n=1 Tax=Macrobrachium rosenbergii TaxID=79674 RepID=UPI0034D4AFFB
MTLGCSLSQSDNTLFKLVKTQAKHMSILGSTPVHSITACAQFCTTYADCKSFNLEVTALTAGNLRLCEATDGQDEKPSMSFSIYDKVTHTSTAPPVLVYQLFKVPNKDQGCSPNRVITTVAFKPNDNTDSDIDFFICSKIDKPVKQSVDSSKEKIIATDAATSEICPDNKVLQGFKSADKEWASPSDLEGRCQLLVNWNVNKTKCLDALPTNDLTYYPKAFTGMNEVLMWTSWLHCPDYYFGVGIRRVKNASTGKYQILSMRCCKIDGTP